MDKGMGIDKRDMARLFDRYYRIQNNQTRYISGFGIGLYLCAEIIKQHHGKTWVESETGVGSIFYFSLPEPSDKP
jgi:signal transduction histidine kinase